MQLTVVHRQGEIVGAALRELWVGHGEDEAQRHAKLPKMNLHEEMVSTCVQERDRRSRNE